MSTDRVDAALSASTGEEWVRVPAHLLGHLIEVAGAAMHAYGANPCSKCKAALEISDRHEALIRSEGNTDA